MKTTIDIKLSKPCTICQRPKSKFMTFLNFSYFCGCGTLKKKSSFLYTKKKNQQKTHTQKNPRNKNVLIYILIY